jgi:hypothetical protein
MSERYQPNQSESDNSLRGLAREIGHGVRDEANYLAGKVNRRNIRGKLEQFWDDEHGSSGSPLERAQAFTELGPMGLYVFSGAALIWFGASTWISTTTSATGFSGTGEPNPEGLVAAAGLNVFETGASIGVRARGTSYLRIIQETVAEGEELDVLQKLPAVGFLGLTVGAYAFDIATTYQGLEGKISNPALRGVVSTVLAFGSELGLAFAENGAILAGRLRAARNNFSSYNRFDNEE